MNSPVTTILPPPLPERELSAFVFAALGLLRPGLKSYRDMLEILVRDFKYDAGERNINAIQAFLRLEELGLVVATKLGTEKVFQLTQQGDERWIREFEYRRASMEFWNQFWDIKTPPRPKGEVKHSEVLIERPPTPEELDAIYKHSDPEFRRILQFVFATKARATDLIFARIEKLKMDEGILVLEAETYTGKPIKNREIQFGDDLRQVLKDAIGRRKSGLIFESTRGRAWQPAHLSAMFRATKKKAKVSEEVKMSGRGGKIGAALAKERVDTRWTRQKEREAAGRRGIASD